MQMGNEESKKILTDEIRQYEMPLAEPPKTVLDIGANVGAFTCLASLIWPEAKIYSFEPESANAECFRRNCQSPNILFSQSAVRSFNGESNMFIGDCAVTHGFHDLGRQTDKTVSVECLDAAILIPAEFIKIDTEGCETEILSRLDLSKAKAIAVEFHCESDRLWIESTLRDAGFQPYQNYNAGNVEGVLRFARPGALAIPTTKLFIGLPVYGAVEVNFWKCTMHLAAEYPVNCMVYPACGDSLVSRARNHITSQFLKSDCTHLLMIDSDLTFSNEHIKRILSHGEDIVGGFYPKKSEGAPQLVCNIKKDQPPMDDRRLLDLKYIGTGFICVARNVFEKMIEVYGKEISYLSDNDRKTIEHDLWPVGVYHYKDGQPSRFLSEDWYFCQRAIDCGFKVWGDMGILLKHSGSATYPLSYQEKEIFTKPMATSSSDSAAASAGFPSVTAAAQILQPA